MSVNNTSLGRRHHIQHPAKRPFQIHEMMLEDDAQVFPISLILEPGAFASRDLRYPRRREAQGPKWHKLVAGFPPLLAFHLNIAANHMSSFHPVNNIPRYPSSDFSTFSPQRHPALDLNSVEHRKSSSPPSCRISSRSPVEIPEFAFTLHNTPQAMMLGTSKAKRTCDNCRKRKVGPS